MLVGKNDRSLPRLLVLAGKIFAGIRRNVIRPAKGCTSPRAVLKDNQALVALASSMGYLTRSLSGTWSWSVTIRSAGKLKEVGLK
jgi:hypothetical protein